MTYEMYGQFIDGSKGPDRFDCQSIRVLFVFLAFHSCFEKLIKMMLTFEFHFLMMISHQVLS